MEQGLVPAAAPTSYRWRPPSAVPGVVARGRLDELYSSLLEEHQALGVVASAGSGKTVQAQMFAAAWGAPTAWLTLDRQDASGARLLSDLASALTAWVPDARSVVETALRSGYQVAEVAVLLAELVADLELLFVIDECEAVGGSEDAAAVLAGFVGHLSSELQLMLLSREELPGPVARLVIEGRVAKVVDEQLRLTEDEVAAVLHSQIGAASTELATRVLEVTGGWVAGVAFWPGEGSSEGSSESVPVDLDTYLSAEILDRLSPEEASFVLDTSILEVVSPRAAAAICGYDTVEVWRRLLLRHLPATVTADGSLVYHQIFRSFLRHQLEVRQPERMIRLRRAHAAHLADSARYEEATELYIRLEALDAAAETAELSIDRLYQRADWPVLLSWLDAIGEDRVRHSPRLLAARIRALHGTRHFDEARSLIREGERLGWMRPATDADPGLVATMAWTLQDDPATATRLLDTYRGDYRVDAARFMVAACSGIDPATPPRGAGWADLERLVSWGLLIQGRLNDLTKMIDPQGEGPVVNTTLVLALASSGQHAEAWKMLGRVPEQMRDRAQTHFVRGWLLLDEGDFDGALAAVEAALTESRTSGFGLYSLYVVFSARILLRLGQVDEAWSVLDDVMPTVESQGKRFLVEWCQVLLGRGYLERGDLKSAELVLSEATRSMKRANRLLFLPVAYIYLAEVERRLGLLERSRDSAGLAYETTSRTGAFHWLVSALDEMPAILERERADEDAQRQWSRLVETYVPCVGRVRERAVRPLAVTLQSFGPHPDLCVDGTWLQVGRLKVIELVAYLALHPAGVERHELQRQLFADVDLRRGGNHFRQIAHKLHGFTGLRLARGARGEVHWPVEAALDSTDAMFERLAGEAGVLQGEARLERLKEAIDLVSGDYLDKSDLPWAEQRRYQIDVIREQTLLEMIGLRSDARDFAGVTVTAEQLIEINPLCVEAYRFLFDVERMTGSDASCIAVYRRATRALSDLGMSAEEVRGVLGGRHGPILAVAR